MVCSPISPFGQTMTPVGHEHRPATAADAPYPLFVRAFEYPRGYRGHTHRHRLAQVVYPIRGAVSVTTRAGTWMVTERAGVAVPPWHEHRVSAHGNASLRSVFVDPDVYPDLAAYRVTTIRVSPLLHELISEAGRRYPDADGGGDDVGRAVADLMVRLLPGMTTPDESLWVPRVDHPLLRPVADALDAEPGHPGGIETWAGAVGLSPRHFSRLFKQDTGVTFSTWRALHRTQAALVLLAGGRPVTRVATDLGYGTTSAFIEMFKRHTGRTPGSARRSA
jgi:AraC-like DNA-binding protein/quercetin dioxygenase-like cupin family protein